MFAIERLQRTILPTGPGDPPGAPRRASTGGHLPERADRTRPATRGPRHQSVPATVLRGRWPSRSPAPAVVPTPSEAPAEPDIGIDPGLAPHDFAGLSFRAELVARWVGAAPVQLSASLVDLACSAVAARVGHAPVGGALAQSGIGSGLKIGAELMVQVMVSTLTQAPPVVSRIGRTGSGRSGFESTRLSMDREARLQVADLSALLATGNSLLAQSGWSLAAGGILRQTPQPADIVSGLVSGWINGGAWILIAVMLYRTRPEFRQRVDIEYVRMRATVRRLGRARAHPAIELLRLPQP